MTSATAAEPSVEPTPEPTLDDDGRSVGVRAQRRPSTLQSAAADPSVPFAVQRPTAT